MTVACMQSPWMGSAHVKDRTQLASILRCYEILYFWFVFFPRKEMHVIQHLMNTGILFALFNHPHHKPLSVRCLAVIVESTKRCTVLAQDDLYIRRIIPVLTYLYSLHYHSSGLCEVLEWTCFQLLQILGPASFALQWLVSVTYVLSLVLLMKIRFTHMYCIYSLFSKAILLPNVQQTHLDVFR